MAKIIEYEKEYVEQALHISNENHPEEQFVFAGFVVKNLSPDRFLIKDQICKDTYKWGDYVPSKAKRFTRLKAAQKIATKFGGDARAEILLEGNTIFITSFNEI